MTDFNILIPGKLYSLKETAKYKWSIIHNQICRTSILFGVCPEINNIVYLGIMHPVNNKHLTKFLYGAKTPWLYFTILEDFKNDWDIVSE